MSLKKCSSCRKKEEQSDAKEELLKEVVSLFYYEDYHDSLIYSYEEVLPVKTILGEEVEKELRKYIEK